MYLTERREGEAALPVVRVMLVPRRDYKEEAESQQRGGKAETQQAAQADPSNNGGLLQFGAGECSSFWEPNCFVRIRTTASELTYVTSLLAVPGITVKTCTKTFSTQILALVPSLRAFAMSMLGNRDRADDLTQETILKAWMHMDSFEEGTNLRAWLFTIMRNNFISQCRRNAREVEDPDGLKAEARAHPPEQEGHMDLQDLRRALTQVPPEQREALLLVAGAGFSYEEAAAIIGCPVGTIKSRINRGRLKLAELLELVDPLETGALTAATIAHTAGKALVMVGTPM
jgi:RNA polymerase sigma-70 factor (ECF subfamily)